MGNYSELMSSMIINYFVLIDFPVKVASHNFNFHITFFMLAIFINQS